MPASLITRFAPSPTGFLHIGGARTALFNWLYAKQQKGKMLLRIEDTDIKRSNPEAIDAIFEGLTWLGLCWDGEPIFQLTRQKRHQEIAQQLIDKNLAYYCYMSSEELESLREKNRLSHQSFKSPWRDNPNMKAPQNCSPVVRLKTPQNGETIIHDEILGRIIIPNKDIGDFILLRSDGTPTYMLSVVVDDHDMQVNSILRGDDHLTNAAKQILIYQALNWPIPLMAHIPLIHGEDGTKLSKRHGALGIEYYRAMGYLPEALCNYLAKLGCGYGDQEIMSFEEMCKYFSLKHINKAPARFDFKKLEFVNQHYMRSKTDSDLQKEALKFLQYFDKGEEILKKLTEKNKQQLLNAMPVLKERSKTLLELWQNAEFILSATPFFTTLSEHEEPLSLNKALLKDLYERLDQSKNWDKQFLLQDLKAYAEEKKIKFIELAHPLRQSLAGKKIALGIGDLLEILGQKEVLSRLKMYL